MYKRIEGNDPIVGRLWLLGRVSRIPICQFSKVQKLYQNDERIIFKKNGWLGWNHNVSISINLNYGSLIKNAWKRA